LAAGRPHILGLFELLQIRIEEHGAVPPAIRAHVIPRGFQLVQTEPADVTPTGRTYAQGRSIVIQAKHGIPMRVRNLEQ
jgi:hypothetical protein